MEAGISIIACKFHFVLDHAEEPGFHAFLLLLLNVGAHTIICTANTLANIDGALGFLLDKNKNTTPFFV